MQASSCITEPRRPAPPGHTTNEYVLNTGKPVLTETNILPSEEQVTHAHLWKQQQETMSIEQMMGAVLTFKCFVPRVAKAIVAGVSVSMRHKGSMRKVTPVFIHYRSIKFQDGHSNQEREDFMHSLSDVFAILQEYASQCVFCFALGGHGEQHLGSLSAHYVSSVQFETHNRYNATVLQFLVDDKGAVAVVGVGLPPYSVSEAEVRAVRLALKVRHKSKDISIGDNLVMTSIGIASGNCFCSVIGTERRSEYAVFGQPMILAARLMQGDNECNILCDLETKRGASRTFDFQDMGKRKLKGFEGTEIDVFHATGKKDKWNNVENQSVPFFGREEHIQVSGINRERWEGGRESSREGGRAGEREGGKMGVRER